MKILTAIYTIKKGGYYDRFLMMVDSFLERKCEVHCLSLKPVPIKNPFFHNYVVFYPFQNKESLLSKTAVVLLFPLCSIWIGFKNKIDIIIAFGSVYGLILIFAKFLLHKPMITFIRGYSSNNILNLHKIIECFIIKKSNKIIVNNKPLYNNILQFLNKERKKTVDLLYNNINQINIQTGKSEREKIISKYRIPIDSTLIITAGIINRNKNVDTLIKCLSKINLKNIYLIIAGDSSSDKDLQYLKYLKSLSKNLEIVDKIIFTGWLKKEDLWRTYHVTDLFVLPSLKEGMPNALLEALSLGLPCIGSRIPGIQDILKYDELLFDPLNEEMLAKKIRDILFDQHFLKRVKTLCEERKKEFIFDWKEKVFQIVTQEVSSVKIS
ncbi:MAG: glycosyltransferase family 4 protein [Thermoplasmata archaeon]